MDNNSVITRSDPEYTDGNTNFKITCNSSGTSYIYFRDRVNYGSGVNEYTVKVVVRDPSKDIYMMHNGNRELIEEVLKEENKYDFRDPLTIYALEGEKFTLSVTKNGGAYNLIGENCDSNYLK